MAQACNWPSMPFSGHLKFLIHTRCNRFGRRYDVVRVRAIYSHVEFDTIVELKPPCSTSSGVRSSSYRNLRTRRAYSSQRGHDEGSGSPSIDCWYYQSPSRISIESTYCLSCWVARVIGERLERMKQVPSPVHLSPQDVECGRRPRFRYQSAGKYVLFIQPRQDNIKNLWHGEDRIPTLAFSID